MKTIDVRTGRPYQVLIGKGLLKDAGRLARPLVRGSRTVIVGDSNVMPIYGDAVASSFSEAGFETSAWTFKAGEASKNPSVLLALLNHLASLRLTRAPTRSSPGRRRDGDLAGLGRFPLSARHRLCPDPDVAPRDGRFERRRQNRRQSRVRQKPHGRLSSARARGLRPGLPRDAARSRNVLRLGRSHQVRGPQGRRAFSRCSKAPSPKTS